LAKLIREAHFSATKYAGCAQRSAAVAIEDAVNCGGYLREAKSGRDSKGQRFLNHGEFLPWLKRETNVDPRTASNYMRLHIWVCSHRTEILAAKPHSLRQFYILAGILSEDESNKLTKENPDDLAKLRRLVRKVTAEAAAHRDYAEVEDLWKALAPLAALLTDVGTDTRTKWKHVNQFRPF
jgi:hypothetical protein